MAAPGVIEADRVSFVFVYRKDFQPRAIRIHVADVHRVAMAEPGGVKALAIVVNNHRVVDDFVLAVRINVGHGQRMAAHARNTATHPRTAGN